MDNKVYHQTLKQMHEAGVSMAYYHGWASGALGNPALEEQRITEAYEAGYADGESGKLDGYQQWLDQGH